VLRVWAIDDRAGGVAGPQLDGRTACDFSPDGRTLAVGDGFGQTLLLDAKTGAVRARPPQHTERAKEVGFSPDGRLFVSAADDGRLWLSDARNGSPIATFTGVDPTSSQSVVFSPDGRRLAVLCRDRSAKILDVPSLAVLVTLQLSTIHQAISVNWSPDGTRLVTSCRDRMIRVWSVDGTELAARSTDSATSWSAEYSPDGKMIAVGSWLRWVELRDPETLEVRAILQGAFGLITRVGWLPQEPGTNPLLYASSSDGAIRVWDTVSERLLFEFNPFPSSDMTDAALSRDGRYLAVTGAWGECIIWDLREWDRWSSRRLRTPTPAAAGRT
jgi:WD40 repeat protein